VAAQNQIDTSNDARQRLPAVHRLLSERRIAAFEAILGRECVKRQVNEVLGKARHEDGRDGGRLIDSIVARLESCLREGLIGVVNGTGILLHTNLGRAPLAGEAFDAARALATGYCNIEYDLEAGARGSRYARVGALLVEITGAQDSLLVNNCAAAVLLILDTFAKRREVIVSRGQLVEIGGGFRLPEIFERCGATLVEVGTANKVYVKDFERALSTRTGLLFRSHLSNFAVRGFVEEVPPAALVALGARAGVAVVEDLGTGALVDLQRFGLRGERTVQQAVQEGLDLVAFSGDKLLGGPQAGIIVGKRALVARLRANPLLRALRVDKVTLALLVQTLRVYATQEYTKLPLFAMLATPLDDLRKRAAEYCARVPGARAARVQSCLGGGTLPDASIDSYAVQIDDARAELAVRLRAHSPPIVGRIEDGKLFLDLRTISPAEDVVVMRALQP